MYCRWCGAELNDNSRHCLYCGQELKPKNSNKNIMNIFLPMIVVVLITIFFIGYTIYDGNKDYIVKEKSGRNVGYSEKDISNSKKNDCETKIGQLGEILGWEEIPSPENKKIIENQFSGLWYDAQSARYELDENYFTGDKYEIVKMYKNNDGYFLVISHTDINPQDLYAYQTFNNGAGVCMQDVKSYYCLDEKVSEYLTDIYDRPLLLGYNMLPYDEFDNQGEENNKDELKNASKEEVYEFAKEEIKSYFYQNLGLFDAIAAAGSIVFRYDDIDDIVYDCYRNSEDGTYYHYLGFYIVLDEYGLGLSTTKEFAQVMVYDDGKGFLKLIVE